MADDPLFHRAYDQLAGEGRWLAPKVLGTIPIRFPSPRSPGDDGWHVDVSFGTERPGLRLADFTKQGLERIEAQGVMRRIEMKTWPADGAEPRRDSEVSILLTGGRRLLTTVAKVRGSIACPMRPVELDAKVADCALGLIPSDRYDVLRTLLTRADDAIPARACRRTAGRPLLNRETSPRFL